MDSSRRRKLRLLLGCGIIVVASCSGGDDDEILKVDERLKSDSPETCLVVDPLQGPEVEDLTWVKCTTEHTHEVYHVADFVADGATESTDVYPGFPELESFAQRECLGAFEPYVGISAFDSDLFYSWMVPTLTSWVDHKDYEIICVAGMANSQKLSISIAGTRL